MIRRTKRDDCGTSSKRVFRADEEVARRCVVLFAFGTTHPRAACADDLDAECMTMTNETCFLCGVLRKGKM